MISIFTSGCQIPDCAIWSVTKNWRISLNIRQNRTGLDGLVFSFIICNGLGGNNVAGATLKAYINNLCKDHKARVRRKDTCSVCRKELKSEDIIKGFEYNGSYIIISKEDLSKLSTKKDKTIKIDYFTDVTEIRPVYYQTAYHALPDQGGEKAFILLSILRMPG